MNKLVKIILVIVFCGGANSFEGIDCRPGMGNCPDKKIAMPAIGKTGGEADELAAQKRPSVMQGFRQESKRP